METNKIYQGDALDVLKTFPDKSIDMCITSPPYWNLRDYNTVPQIWGGDKDCEHDWVEEIRKPAGGKGSKSSIVGANKNDFANMRDHDVKSGFCSRCGAWEGQLGLEPSHNLYISHLGDIFDGVKRVLKDEGSLYVVIGDTYGGQKIGNDDLKNPNVNTKSFKKITPGIKSKCLVGIPERFKIEMIDRGWINRNVIIWEKPNQMPNSAKDRFTGNFEFIYFFSRQGKYYFEQQFEPYAEPLNRWGGDKLKVQGDSDWDIGTGQETYRDRDMRPNPLGRNLRCVWRINTECWGGSHYAVFPQKLIETPIKASCPKGGIVLDPFFGGWYYWISCNETKKKVYRNRIKS